MIIKKIKPRLEQVILNQFLFISILTLSPVQLNAMDGHLHPSDSSHAKPHYSSDHHPGAHDYTVNLMWINKKLDPKQQFIHPAKTEEELHKDFLNPTFGWAKKNPEAIVQVWYDSHHTSDTAVENTKKHIEKHTAENPKSAPIVLRDVRSLEEVNSNPKVFSKALPIFFRVDLLRAVAGYHEAKSGKPFFYADIDVEPKNREQIFDKETVDNLNKHGISFAKGTRPENSMQVIGNKNPHTLKAMKEVLIDLNLSRAKYAYEHIKTPDQFFSLGSSRWMVPNEMVYWTYPTMMLYSKALEGGFKMQYYSADIDFNHPEKELKVPALLKPFRDDGKYMSLIDHSSLKNMNEYRIKIPENMIEEAEKKVRSGEDPDAYQKLKYSIYLKYGVPFSKSPHWKPPHTRGSYDERSGYPDPEDAPDPDIGNAPYRGASK